MADNREMSQRDKERLEEMQEQKREKSLLSGLANITKEIGKDNQKAFDDLTGKFTDAVSSIPEQMKDFSKGFLKTVAMSNPLVALSLGAGIKSISSLGKLFVDSNEMIMEEEESREDQIEAKVERRETKKISIFQKMHDQMALVHSELELVHDALLSNEEAEKRRFERAERQRQEAENLALFQREEEAKMDIPTQTTQDTADDKKSGPIARMLRVAGGVVMRVIGPFMSALKFIGGIGKKLGSSVIPKTVLTKVVGFLGGVFGFFTDAEEVFGSDLGFTGKDLGKRIVGAVVGFFKAIPSLIGNVMDLVFNMVTGGDTSMFSDAVNTIADGVMGFFGNLIDIVFGNSEERLAAAMDVKDFIGNIAGFIGYLFETAIDQLKSAISAAGDFITDLPDLGTLLNMVIGGFLSGIPNWALDLLPDRWANQIKELQAAYGQGQEMNGPELLPETRTVETEQGRFSAMDEYEQARREPQKIEIPAPIVSVAAPQTNQTTVLAPGGSQRNEDITVRRIRSNQNEGY